MLFRNSKLVYRCVWAETDVTGPWHMLAYSVSSRITRLFPRLARISCPACATWLGTACSTRAGPLTISGTTAATRKLAVSNTLR